MQYITRNWMAFSTALAILAMILSMTMALSVPNAQALAEELDDATAKRMDGPPTPVFRETISQSARAAPRVPSANFNRMEVPLPVKKPRLAKGEKSFIIRGLYEFLYTKIEKTDVADTSPHQFNQFVCMKRDTALVLPSCHLMPSSSGEGLTTG